MKKSVEQIAAGLSDAERSAILSREGPVDVIQSIEPYWFAFSKIKSGYFSISLNATGQSVRAILKEQADAQ